MFFFWLFEIYSVALSNNHSKMENSKEYIIEKAYELYLRMGYDGVSITVLQEELGIGRATIYYYFSNKDELFVEIIKRYMINVVKEFIQKAERVDLTVPKMIEMLGEMQGVIRQSILKSFQGLKYSHYTALALYAYIHYTGFREFTETTLKKICLFWETAIRNSIKRGEVRPNVNVEALASIFSSIKCGDELDMTKDEFTLIPQGFLERSNYLYSLIKVE